MDSERTLTQKIILILLLAMAVIFAVLTAVSRSRPGVAFHDTLLRISQTGDRTVYSGSLRGSEIAVASRPEGADTEVTLSVDGRLRHTYRLEWPEGSIATDYGALARRIRITEDGAVTFEGGVLPNGDSFYLVDEDGFIFTGAALTMVGQSNPVASAPNLTAWQVVRFAGGQARSVRGSWGIYAAALLLSVFCALETAFPRGVFYLAHMLSVRDPEPTEFYLLMQRLSCVLLTAVAFGVYLYGLRLIQ